MALGKWQQSSPPGPGVDTIPKLFWQRVHEWADRTAMREKDFGLWKDIPWRHYGRMAKYVGLALLELGLEKGDRAAIISDDVPEWLYCDLGIQCLGGATVGIYPTDSPQQVRYVMAHSGSKFYFAEDEEQLDKVLEIRETLPELRKIIIYDMEGLRHFKDPMAMSFEALLELGKRVDEREVARFERRLQETRPDDTAFLIYTSGTTGPPKGAMITHRNVLAGFQSQRQVLTGYMNDELLTFLPLCHIAERGVTAVGMIMNGWVCNFAEEMDTVPQDIREVSPTVFFAVPRIWERFYSALVLRMKDATWLERKAFRWAMAVGRACSDYRLNLQNPPLQLRAAFAVVEWCVLRNLKKSVGLHRVRMCLSGAAPISPDLLKFYHSLGIDMREVYGQTESTGAATMHFEGRTKFGTVGEPLPGIEVRISEEGEILIKGPTVFKGYFNDPDKTAETVREGWLYTGDVGLVDPDGHVVIKDRLKDIIITSGGKNITPSEIENQLKFSPYINDAVVIGDGRKYLTALIMIDDENVMKYAQENRIPFTTYASLTKAKEVIKLIQNEVDEVNKKFARVETVKKFRLIDIQLTTDDEEITPTMKLKRKYINKKFKDVIETMY